MTDDSGSDVGPAWSHDGRRIAFIRETSRRYAVYTVPAAGGSPRQVVDLGEREVQGISWSPDDRFLALAVQTEPRETFAISLLSLETLEERRLTDPPADHVGDVLPAFSLSGDRIAFVRRRMEKVDDVFVVSSGGGSPARLTYDHAEITGLDWWPTGGEVVYSSDREGSSALWRVSVSGGAPRWIPAMSEGTQVYQPTIARRAGRMVLVQRSLVTNIWELDLETGRTGSVIASTRLDEAPDLTADGRRLAFISNRGGSFEVWTSDRDGLNLSQLTEMNGPLVSTARWSPDGSHVAFVARVAGNVDVYVIDAAGGTPRRLTSSESNDREPQWSRDGQSIYFASNRTGRWEIWKRPAWGGEPVRMTRNGGFSAMESPDGQWLFFVKRHVPGIWRMPLSGGEEERVVDEVEPYDWGNWTVDADALYFVARDSTGARLLRQDVQTGTRQVLATLSQFPKMPALTFAPDGRSLLYTRVDRSDGDLLLAEL